MRGIIGIPTTGLMSAEFVQSLIALEIPPGTEISIIARSSIHVARERMALEAMKQGYDWIFFLDDDMTFEPGLLLQLLRHDAPVVTAMAFKRVHPYTPCFYRSLETTERGIEIKPFEFDERPDKPFAAAAVGAACLLIRREVFERVAYPWFLPLPFCGEDISFCLRLQQHQIPILVDPEPMVGHIETRPVGLHEYLGERARTEGAL